MTEIHLSSIKYPETEELIYTWQYLESKTVRCYYKPSQEHGDGFKFYAVEQTGGILTDEYQKDDWHPQSCFVECMYFGSSNFEGVKHIYMGDEQTDNYGYHYYPDIKANLDTLCMIDLLQKNLCREKAEPQTLVQ